MSKNMTYKQKLINENNISNKKGEYKCGRCKNYTTNKIADFKRHLNRKTSCVIEEKTINGRNCFFKDNKYFVKPISGDGKNMKICPDCIIDNKIKFVHSGEYCEDHGGGEAWKWDKCKWKGERCTKNGILEGYCGMHYKLIDKEDKKFQCSHCKNTFSDKRPYQHHIENVDCLKRLEEKEKYKDNLIIVDGYSRYKCLLCNHIYDDVTALKRHWNQTQGKCKEDLEIAEKVKDYEYRDKNDYKFYFCSKCNLTTYIRKNFYIHLTGNKDCNPNYEIKNINDKKIQFIGENKYIITNGENGQNKNLCCKFKECYMKSKAGGFCVNHGGSLKNCLFDSCDRKGVKKGFCKRHFNTMSEEEINKIREEKIIKQDPLVKNIKKIINSFNDKDKSKVITVNYALDLFNDSDGLCYWCKKKVCYDNEEPKLNQLSLDRLDNSKGHIEDNLVISCCYCNKARNATDTETWEKYMNCLINNDLYIDNEIYDNNWTNDTIKHIKRRSQIKKYDFDLTEEWIKEQFNKNNKSHYTNIEMFSNTKAYNPFQPSIDRIDNNKGYTQDNCVLCCVAENYGRGDTDYDKFKKWIYNNFIKKETINNQEVKDI